VHTFTPLLRGHRRDVDIGLLFDPARAFERRVASAWGRQLQLALPRLRIRRNKPYKGTDDGLTTHLRARLPDRRYAGIELEVNQRFPRRAGPAWSALQESIAASLRAALLALPEHAAR
jgi:predicted N-formylglutamate amidohydrolase